MTDQLMSSARDLADAVEAALPAWVVRSVERILGAWREAVGEEIDGREPALASARAAGERAQAEIVPEVRRLLETDVDQQWTNPLDVLRRATRYPTEVLRAEGVPEVERDEFAVRAFPDDVYDLAPASFADIDPALHELGLRWGAAKAHVVLLRRRRGAP